MITGDPAGIRRSDTDERNTFQEIQEAFDIEPFPARSNAWQARFNAVDSFLMKRISKSVPALLVSAACPLTHRGFMGEYKLKRMAVTGQERYTSKPDKNLVANVHDALQYAAMFTEDMYNLMTRDRDSETVESGTGWGAYT